MKEVLEHLNERLLLELSFEEGPFQISLFWKTSISSNNDFFHSSSPVSSICAVKFRAILQVFSFSRWAIKRNFSIPRTNYFSREEIISVSVIRVVLILVAATGNMMNCFIIYRKPGLCTPTNISILFLRVSDILMAVLIMPFSLVSSIKGKWIFSQGTCTFSAWLIFVSLGASFMTIACTGIIHYFCVVKPSLYRKYVKPKTVARGISLSWLKYSISRAAFLKYGRRVLQWETDLLYLHFRQICQHIKLWYQICPFIYGFTNRGFRKEYLELLRSLLPLGAQVAPAGAPCKTSNFWVGLFVRT